MVTVTQGGPGEDGPIGPKGEPGLPGVPVSMTLLNTLLLTGVASQSSC